jgi:hypothetical protein
VRHDHQHPPHVVVTKHAHHPTIVRRPGGGLAQRAASG